MKILNDLKTRSPRNAAEIALIYVGLGEKDQAMKWLEKAYAEHFNPSILVRPAFDPLRSDPRFQNLVHRIGLASAYGPPSPPTARDRVERASTVT